MMSSMVLTAVLGAPPLPPPLNASGDVCMGSEGKGPRAPRSSTRGSDELAAPSHSEHAQASCGSSTSRRLVTINVLQLWVHVTRVSYVNVCALNSSQVCTWRRAAPTQGLRAGHPTRTYVGSAEDKQPLLPRRTQAEQPRQLNGQRTSRGEKSLATNMAQCTQNPTSG